SPQDAEPGAAAPERLPRNRTLRPPANLSGKPDLPTRQKKARSEKEPELDAEGVRVPRRPGQRPAVARVEVGPGAEPQSQARLDVDDGVAGSALHHEQRRRHRHRLLAA